MSKITLVLADDHRLFRDGMKAMLQTDSDMVVVGEAEQGSSLLSVLASTIPNVLLLDVSMPEDNGLALLPTIKKQFPATKCLMLTMHDDVQYVLRSLKLGADGYVLKEVDAEELKTAIREIHAGRKYFKNKISDLIVTNLLDPPPPETLLSEREVQIVHLVAEGKITKEIAEQLCVSVRTVETHRSRIMKKLGVANSAEMVRTAYERKLI